MTQALSIERDAAEVGGGAPAPAPTYLLFIYVLVSLPLAGRWNRRFALSRGELLLIYTMMLVAGRSRTPMAWASDPHTVSPLYYKAHEPLWSLFQNVLPSWMGPTSDPAAIKTFFQAATARSLGGLARADGGLVVAAHRSLLRHALHQRADAEAVG